MRSLEGCMESKLLGVQRRKKVNNSLKIIELLKVKQC